MKLLRVDGPEGLSVLLFGLGLIGGAVEQALRLRFRAVAREFPYDWQAPGARHAQRAAIAAALPAGDQVALVWTGGSGGFGSQEAEMAAETAIVAELVDWAQDLRRGRRVDFHLTSSAGGLFEGQTHCTALSLPHPLRPYGAGKLAQEEILARADLDRRHVYRPSSVYGVGRSKRVGLVTMLVSNALTGRVTRIFGNPNTLRDYVLSDDIGRFMAGRIVRPGAAAAGGETAAEVLLMANGRPASVLEVIELVRARVERPVLLQFDPHPSNARDMSFLPSALPPDWRPTPLASGIAGVVVQLRNRLI